MMILISVSCGLENGRCCSIFEKCKCLHEGHGKTGMNYEMGGSKTEKERDLVGNNKC